MPPSYELLVISGLHRSGTTFAGEILHQASSIPIVHEPLNERYGVVGVPVAYPYVDARGTRECAPFARLINDILSFSREWNKDVKYIERNVILRTLYSMTGGRSGIKWGYLKLKKLIGAQPEKLCWKDPFASLATPYLLESCNARIVCMVRHPAAIYRSTVKQGWWFDVENIASQGALIRDHGQDVRKDHWELARKSHAAGIALLWKMMVRINIPLAEKDQRLMLVRHEDLCCNAEQTAKRIVAHMGFEYTPKVGRYVASMSSGKSVEGELGKVHSFLRDSKRVAEAWRGKLSDSEENVMREIIGDDLSRCYKEW